MSQEKEGVASPTISLLAKNRRHREILYKTLQYCCELRSFEDAEAFVSQLPECVFGQILQSPRTLIGFLEESGGLERVSLAGGVADPEGGEEPWGLRTTADGQQALEACSPRARLARLERGFPARSAAFREVVRYCDVPRSFEEIRSHYRQNICAGEAGKALGALDADYFVSKLEAAGGLVWTGKWTATAEGRSFIEGERKTEETKLLKEECACLTA